MEEEINWDDPEARLALVERIGVEAYNRAFGDYVARNPIRAVSSRYGTLYLVSGTGRAFATREEAEECLAAWKPVDDQTRRDTEVASAPGYTYRRDRDGTEDTLDIQDPGGRTIATLYFWDEPDTDAAERAEAAAKAITEHLNHWGRGVWAQPGPAGESCRAKARRGFHHFAESWYYRHRREDAPVDDVCFGLYATEGNGGCEAEMVMEWVPLGDFRTPTARLRVFDESFSLLSDFADVWKALAGRQKLKPKEFCELLKQCGFQDLTERKGPRD
jgi:hypothetical protein